MSLSAVLIQLATSTVSRVVSAKVSSLRLFGDKESIALEQLVAEWKSDLIGRNGQATANALSAFLDLPYVKRELEKVRGNKLGDVNFDGLGNELHKLFQAENAPEPEKAGIKLRRWWRVLEKSIQPDAIAVHEAWRLRYLQAIYKQHSMIEFTGLADARGVKSAQMDSLFELPRLQPLDQGERKPSKADAFLANAATPPRAIILGKPGAGKTTLLKCMAFSAAAHALERHKLAAVPAELGWAKSLRTLLPVFYRIRALVKDHTRDSTLWNCLYVHASGAMGLDLPRGFFEREADTGGLFLMFDGLDEAGSPATRNELARRLETFADSLQDSCALVVSSRPHDYSHQFPALAHYELCDLDDKEVESIIRKSGPIYEKDKAAATARANALIAAVKDEAREYLSEMARTALLLAMIVRVHFITGSLPGTRRDLYAKCVDTLLEHWSAELGTGPIPATIKERFLRQLAYELQTEAGGDLSSREDHLRVSKKDLARRLTAFLQEECPAEVTRVDDVIRLLHERDAILVYDTGSPNGEEAFRFVHRTFQEYFAGCYLAIELPPGELEKRVKEDPPGWNETLYLAIASLGNARTRERVLLDLLFENRIQFALEAIKASRDVAQWLEMLTRFLVRYYGDGSGPAADEVAELCRTRPKAREVLDHLFRREMRDARSLASAVELVEALGGSESLTAFFEESKQCGLDTTNDMADCDGFWMDKYLVTNANFECMIPARKAAREKDRYSSQPDQPVIDVSWWEAQLYCRWRGQGFGLPTDEQWVKAAYWDRKLKRNREYPWGDERGGDSVANTTEAGLGRTSPVGAYPDGKSDYGCFDMGGNVWEWTSLETRGGGGRRVRGGSWGNGRDLAARSDDGDYYLPFIRGSYLGFRCSRT